MSAGDLRRLRLRNGTEANIDDVIRIWRDVWRDSYASFFGVTADEMEWLNGAWHELLPVARDIVLAELNGCVVGFCLRDGPIVEDLWVDPVHCSRGIGPRLLDHALRAMRADGYRTATLFCLEAAERARHFYEREGWRHCLRQQRMPPDGKAPFWMIRYEYDLDRLGRP